MRGQPQSQRRRLQRFLARAIDLGHWFGEWTQSVMQSLSLTEVMLAIDETNLEDRFGVMVVALVHRRRCIPVACAPTAPTTKPAILPKGR